MLKQNEKGHFGQWYLVTVATPGYITMLCISSFPTRVQANLGHTMPDGLIVDSDFKENYRT